MDGVGSIGSGYAGASNTQMTTAIGPSVNIALMTMKSVADIPKGFTFGGVSDLTPEGIGGILDILA